MRRAASGVEVIRVAGEIPRRAQRLDDQAVVSFPLNFKTQAPVFPDEPFDAADQMDGGLRF